MLQDGGLWDGLSGFDSLKTGLSALSSLFCPQQRAVSLFPRPLFLCKTGLAHAERFLCEIADLLLLSLFHQQRPFRSQKFGFLCAVSLGKLKRAVAGCKPLKLSGLLLAASLV